MEEKTIYDRSYEDLEKEENLNDYDYEIIVGLITTITKGNYKEDKEKTTMLPVDGDTFFNSWIDDRYKLSATLKEHGILDNTFHYDRICCEAAHYYFGHNENQGSKRLIQLTQHSFETGHPTQYVLRCPWCGSRLKFVYKNLGTFKSGKVKKEVCSITYEKL